MTLSPFDSTIMTSNFKRAVDALRNGSMVLLLDAHDRENEGDLIVAAEKITKDTMNFLIKKGSGVVCLAMPKARLDKLGIPLMSPDNTNFFQTAFTVSIEAKTGVTTGVSAKDRAHTVLIAISDDTESTDLARPGHVFPLAAQKYGVFDRMGHTEGSVDLMQIAKLKPGAVLCELMNDDGSMTVGEERLRFAKKYDIPVVTVEEILFYRMQTENIFNKSTKKIESRYGELNWHSFCFFDQFMVNVFCRCHVKPKFAYKIAISPGRNLANRFFAQVLEQNVDDPLIDALSGIKEGKLDFAIFCSGHDLFLRQTPQELKLFEASAICRVLKELSIANIYKNALDQDFVRIAHNYFSIEFTDECSHVC